MATLTSVLKLVNGSMEFVGNAHTNARNNFSHAQFERLDGALNNLEMKLQDLGATGALKAFYQLQAYLDKHDDGVRGALKEGKGFKLTVKEWLRDIKDLARDHVNKQQDHHDDHPLPVTQLNASLAEEGNNGSGNMWVGSGIPVTDFQKQATGAFEVALNGNYRQGDTVKAFSVDQKGAVHFDLPGGTQVVDPAHNVPSDNPNRAAASFNYSVTIDDDGPYGSWGAFLSDNKVELKIDIDPSSGVSYLTLGLFHDEDLGTGSADTYWATKFADGTPDQIIIADDAGNDHASQNSQNMVFYKAVIEAFTGQEYDYDGIHTIEMVVTNIHTGQVEADLTTVHHLGGTGLLLAA